MRGPHWTMHDCRGCDFADSRPHGRAYRNELKSAAFAGTTCATISLLLGTTRRALNTVRDVLGHSSINMTLRYAYLAPDERVAEIIDASAFHSVNLKRRHSPKPSCEYRRVDWCV